MRSGNEHNRSLDGDSFRELHLLSEVQSTPRTSQRSLARRLGISLGITNLLLRNLVRKGYVRATKPGWKRWLYTVTPQGFTRRFQLVASYVHRFLDHYQKIRQTLREELETISLKAESRVAICGTGEFAELVYLGLREVGVEEVDFYALDAAVGGKFLGMPVHDYTTLQPGQYDRIMVAMLADVNKTCSELGALGVAHEQLVTFFTDIPRETPEVERES